MGESKALAVMDERTNRADPGIDLLDSGKWVRVYGIITTIGLLLSFALTKGHVQSVESVTKKDENMTFAESVKNFVQNKYFIFALAMTVFVNFAVQINSGSQTYFYTYVMNDVMLTTSLNMVNLIPTILGIMFLSGLP